MGGSYPRYWQNSQYSGLTPATDPGDDPGETPAT